MTKTEKLEPGNGGWCLFEQFTKPYDPDHVMVYVRFSPTAKGRLEIQEMYFAPSFKGAPSATSRLRAFPATKVEAWANESPKRAELILHMDDPAPLVHTAASYYNVDVGWPADEVMAAGVAKRHVMPWVFQMLGSQREQPGSKKSTTLLPSYFVSSAVEPPDLQLQVPAEGTRPYPLEFFEAVAKVYTQAARSYRDPAPRIADANAAMVTTVHRWVKRCRQLGLLPPARQGRRG